MSEETKPVAFRLTVEQLAAVDQAAEERGLKRSDFIREVVLEASMGPEIIRQSDSDELRSLMMNLAWALNRNLQCAVVALLCDAGTSERGEAEKWVREVLDLGRRYDAFDQSDNDGSG